MSRFADIQRGTFVEIDTYQGDTFRGRVIAKSGTLVTLHRGNLGTKQIHKSSIKGVVLDPPIG